MNPALTKKADLGVTNDVAGLKITSGILAWLIRLATASTAGVNSSPAGMNVVPDDQLLSQYLGAGWVVTTDMAANDADLVAIDLPTYFGERQLDPRFLIGSENSIWTAERTDNANPDGVSAGRRSHYRGNKVRLPTRPSGTFGSQLGRKIMTTFVNQAIFQIREMILRGELAPGQRITEEGLTERLAMSRSPIRVALPVLAGGGLLTPSKTRGYFIQAFSQKDASDAIELRGMLEGMAARLIVERRSRTDPGHDFELRYRSHLLFPSAPRLVTLLSKSEGFDWSTNKRAYLTLALDCIEILLAHQF